MQFNHGARHPDYGRINAAERELGWELTEAPDGYPDLQRSRLERAPRLVLPASAAVYGAGEILHLTGGHALEAGVAGVVASAVAYGASGRGRIPGWVTGAVAGTSCWLCAAAQFGPLHGWPEAPLTWGAAAATFLVSRWARRHPAVTAATAHREARAEWLGSKARRWELGGTHLLKREDTRLGEVYELSTRGSGKRASQLTGGQRAELIAEDCDLPSVNRVQVTSPRPGRLRVSIRHTDPWEKPVPHPLLDENPELDLTGPYSILDPAVIGIDPETGNPLDVPLFDELGGKNISIVALKGSGKTVLMNSLSERITAAPDAIQIRLNLSLKGAAEAYRWGPACHLTAFGTQQKKRAVAVLKVIHGIMEWRSATYATTDYKPTPADPAISIIIDEVDSAMADATIRKLVNDIATKGREYGITFVRAGQRGTADYSSGKARSQDDVFLIGRVNRAGEVYHAAGNLGLNLPDMSTYGEGASGVWLRALLGGDVAAGRAFLLPSAPSAAVARDRAFDQPGLPAECEAYLGDAYADLIATDVFAEWAREHVAGNSVQVPDWKPSGENGMAAEPAPVATLEAEKTAFARWENEMETGMDDQTRENIARMRASTGEKLRETLDQVTETASKPLPEAPDPDQVEAFAAARWQQVAENAQIPEEHRPVLLDMLRDGTTGSQVAKRLGVSGWTARTYLERLRNEGAAKVTGEKRTAKWVLAEPEDGDSQ